MRTFLAFAFLALTGTAHAQFDRPGLPGSNRQARSFDDVAEYAASIEPAKAKPGEVVTFTLTVTPKFGCHTYPAMPTTGQAARNNIVLPTAGDVVFANAIVDPPGAVQKGSEQYYTEAATWTFKAVVSPKATAGTKSVSLTGTQLQACTESNCFKSHINEPPTATLEVMAGPAVPVPAEFQALVSAVPAAPSAAARAIEKNADARGSTRKAAVPLERYRADLEAIRASLIPKSDTDPGSSTGGTTSNSLGGLLLAAAFWGFVSLVTPCVFPMIPITISLFLKQSQKSTAGTLKLAGVYSLTIILVLGLSAFALLSVFRAWSVSPVMNVFLGLLFVVFALSLFGMYDLALPNFLLRATEKRRAAGGLLGTVFGALAFSIVSFTCVAPFLGGFAGLAASGNFNMFERILAGLTFATAFASPFFLLALFPSLLKKLPRSGGWLDTVKVVMGFLELAAALKFFRTAELRRPPVEYFTYDVVLGAWVVIAIVTGIYLLGFIRLPHDEERSTVAAPRLVLALLFLGLGVYLLPGLFKSADGKPQRPGGVVFAWVDAFLLPEATAPAIDDLPWSADLKGALEVARKERLATGTPARVLVDFTGVTCTNCKYNENNIFPLPNVKALLKGYTLVQMYTDDVPAEFYDHAPALSERKQEAGANLSFQNLAFGTEQLPLYAILEPLANGKVRIVDVYDEGKINDAPRFAAFLAAASK